MRDMGIRHNESMIADHRFATPLNRPPIDGGKLPDDGVIANDQATLLGMILEMLWLCSKDGMREDPALAPDLCPAIDHHMGTDTGPLTDGHVLAHDRVRSNRHRVAYLGGRGHDRRGMQVD